MTEKLGTYDALLQSISARMNSAHAPFLIGIGGPPATGKSTLAERLVADLEARGTITRFCPMDGFHLTNAQLDERGLRAVKGRIDTFDADAFVSAVQRLKERTSFWWPLYSRQRHDPIPEGNSMSGSEAAFVIEGNYVLAKTEPWRAACNAFDIRIFVDASDELLRDRLMHRHQNSGRSPSEALEKIERTDMPNATAIRNERLTEDILFCERTDV